MRDVLSADELKKLTIENCLPEFKKVIQQFICPICTNVLEDFASCSDCEGLICRPCLNQWLARDSVCPLCKQGFEEMKVSRQVTRVLNMCEFECPYNCGETFTYVDRKQHFGTCSQCVERQKCPFCPLNINQMQNGLMWHVRNDCEGPLLHCQDCNLNVYQIYSDFEYLNQNEGHQCAKDMKRLVGLIKRLRAI